MRRYWPKRNLIKEFFRGPFSREQLMNVLPCQLYTRSAPSNEASPSSPAMSCISLQLSSLSNEDVCTNGGFFAPQSHQLEPQSPSYLSEPACICADVELFQDLRRTATQSWFRSRSTPAALTKMRKDSRSFGSTSLVIEELGKRSSKSSHIVITSIWETL